MEKSVKYILTILLSLVLMISVSGFSVIMHHCNTRDFTEIRLTHHDCSECCGSQKSSCCSKEEQIPSGHEDPASHCISTSCCVEKSIGSESLPEFTNNKKSLFSSLSYASLYQAFSFGSFQVITNESSFLLAPQNPSPKEGRAILALVQTFRL